MILLAFSGSGEAQSVELYVGPERCKACHEYQYEVWSRGPHARATKSLNDKQRQDGRCARCHMTTLSPPVEGISCERCHGPGRYYQREYVMRDKELAALVGLIASPDERSCLSCHGDGSPAIRPFEFDSKWPLIDHSNPSKSESPHY